MGGALEDLERRIDEERARAQVKKAQEAKDKAEAAAKAANKGNSSLFF